MSVRVTVGNSSDPVLVLDNGVLGNFVNMTGDEILLAGLRAVKESVLHHPMFAARAKFEFGNGEGFVIKAFR